MFLETFERSPHFAFRFCFTPFAYTPISGKLSIVLFKELILLFRLLGWF